jgi:hypothetical protein
VSRAVGACEQCGCRDATVQRRDLTDANLRHRLAPLCAECADGCAVAGFDRWSVSYNGVHGLTNTGFDSRGPGGEADFGRRGQRSGEQLDRIPPGGAGCDPKVRTAGSWVQCVTTRPEPAPNGLVGADLLSVEFEARAALDEFGPLIGEHNWTRTIFNVSTVIDIDPNDPDQKVSRVSRRPTAEQVRREAAAVAHGRGRSRDVTRNVGQKHAGYPVTWDCLRSLEEMPRFPGVCGNQIRAATQTELDRDPDTLAHPDGKVRRGKILGVAGRERRSKRIANLQAGKLIEHTCWSWNVARPERREPFRIARGDLAAIQALWELLAGDMGHNPATLIRQRGAAYTLSAWLVAELVRRRARVGEVATALGIDRRRVSERLRAARKPDISLRSTYEGTTDAPPSHLVHVEGGASGPLFHPSRKKPLTAARAGKRRKAA